MELRHAVQFASRTASSRFLASNTSHCRAPISLTVSSRRTYSTDRRTNNLLAALNATPARPSKSSSSSTSAGLPPRPPQASRTSWADLRPSTVPTSQPSPAAGKTGDPYLDDMALLTDAMKWDINEFNSSNSLKKPVPLEMRNLRPSTGRTIERYGNVDVARAFQLLDIAVAKNRVKNDSNMQKFYERPGLKRKRLKSYRWRGVFKAGFRATVRRVQELRAQGW